MTTKIGVTVRYFASIREALAIGAETVDTTAKTVDELRDQLLSRGGSYACLAREKTLRTALDEVMCDGKTLLVDGCTVAFFPPVTGG